MIAKVTSHRFPPGEAWRYGLVPQIACIINGTEGTATFDTGAQPSVISAAVLARHDPVFKTKLLQADLPSLSGYGGRVKVVGVYPCEIIFPHPGKEGNVALDMEFLVTTEKRVPYDILIGCEWQTIYGVSINRNPMHSSCPYISFGKHQQRFAIGTFKDANVAAMEIVPPKRVDERFPSGHENVNYDEFMQILAKPMHASAAFLEHLEEVDINPALSNEQRQQLVKVIAACEHAFVGKDDTVTYGELGAANPLPHMFTSIQSVGRAKYHTSFDVKDGFYNMKLDDESKQWTAFVTPDGLFEWNRCGFGINVYPPEFQRRMSDLFDAGIRQEWLRVYIDDGLISSNELDVHLWHTYISLKTLLIPQMKIALNKTHFGYSELKYLGHKLNGLHIALNEGRVAAIRDWERPKTVK